MKKRFHFFPMYLVYLKYFHMTLLLISILYLQIAPNLKSKFGCKLALIQLTCHQEQINNPMNSAYAAWTEQASQEHWLYLLPSGETSAVFMKLGAELLKIFVLSPPTTTSGPSRETRTARLCRVMATMESLVSRRPSSTCSHNTLMSAQQRTLLLPCFSLQVLLWQHILFLIPYSSQ